MYIYVKTLPKEDIKMVNKERENYELQISKILV